MSTIWIKVAYGVLLGIVLALTAGFGVAVVSSGPRPPQPAGLTFAALSGSSTDQDTTRQAKQIDAFFADAQTYREKYPDYQRNLFVAFAAIGMVIAVLGVALPAVVNYLRFGFLFGGLLLVIAGAYIALQPVPQAAPAAAGLLSVLSYGTPKVLDTAGRFLRFAVSLVGLLVLLFVGLWRLTDWPAPASADTRTFSMPGTVIGNASPLVPAMATVPPGVNPPASVPVAEKWARPGESRLAAEPSESGLATVVSPPAAAANEGPVTGA